LAELTPAHVRLPLPSPSSRFCANTASCRSRNVLAVAWEDHDLVLCTATGQPVGQWNGHRSWTRILVKAGVAHRGIHHLRHAFVTMLAEEGVHERVAQQLAGTRTAASPARSTST
jgi:site-specific recombinase XerD